jgi:hypothetical protein
MDISMPTFNPSKLIMMPRNSLLFQEFSYPLTTGVDFFKRSLPPLPTKNPGNPREFYSAGKSFTLRRLQNRPDDVIEIRIVNCVEVYFKNFSQAVTAVVTKGPAYWVGKTIFAKFYDPLYVSPDDLQTLPGKNSQITGI